MNALSVLEEKVVLLLDILNELKKENAELQAQNASLLKEIKALESSVATDTKTLDALHQEKEATKAVVDDLIKNINALVSNEVQP